MSCPRQRDWMSCADYTARNPGCPCSHTVPVNTTTTPIPENIPPTTVTGGGTGGGHKRELERLLLEYYGTLPIDDAALGLLASEMEELDNNPPSTSAEHFRKASDIYGKYGLTIPQIEAMTYAAQTASLQYDRVELRRLAADMMRTNHWDASAVGMYQTIPIQALNPDLSTSASIAAALQGYARSLERLELPVEAESMFAIANQMISMVGRVQGHR